MARKWPEMTLDSLAGPAVLADFAPMLERLIPP
jgi:hypothetical protein